MDSKQLTLICQQVYKQFPEVKGIQPQVSPQGNVTLLIFKTSAKTADGLTIKRTVRVTASPDGKIIKMTTSR